MLLIPNLANQKKYQKLVNYEILYSNDKKNSRMLVSEVAVLLLTLASVNSLIKKVTSKEAAFIVL